MTVKDKNFTPNRNFQFYKILIIFINFTQI
jgi:hypothetical protein